MPQLLHARKPTVEVPTKSNAASRVVFWLLAFWLPLGLFALHSRLFWPWIVDDAAISFAYSRSLAQGWGLVAQAGAAPVEGYSNLLWVLLMAPFYRLGLFDPVWTPKIISLLLVGGIFWGCARLGQTAGGGENGVALGAPWRWATNWLLAINTPFVVWCVSGLENPLYALLLLLLLGASLKCLSNDNVNAQLWAGMVGALAALVAMTRPDGVTFVAAFPVLVLLAPHRITSEKWKLWGCHGAGYALFFGAFLGFRLLYFGDWVPNTFHAKVGAGRGAMLDIGALAHKFDALSLGVLSVPGVVLALGIAVALMIRWRRGQLDLVLLGTLIIFAIATANFLALPFDWMQEYRFATPLALFGSLLIPLLLRPVTLTPPLWSFGLKTLVLAALVGLAILNFGPRSQKFASDPTVPYQTIAREFGDRFNVYADQLKIKEGSILLPDVGGTLLHSRLRVYDLGMLTDRTIAATLSKDQPAFYNYIFEQCQPTFIHAHGPWAQLAQFDEDPRFRRDYIAIRESQTADQPGGQTPPLMDGDWVRRDALKGHAIAELRNVR